MAMQMPAFGGMATDAWPWVLVAEAEGLWAAHCEAAAGLLICPLRWAAYTVARNQLPAPRRNWKLGAPGHSFESEPRSNLVVVTIGAGSLAA